MPMRKIEKPHTPLSKRVETGLRVPMPGSPRKASPGVPKGDQTETGVQAAVVALELVSAGCSVLQTAFGFSTGQTNDWLQQTIALAGQNRELLLRQTDVEALNRALGTLKEGIHDGNDKGKKRRR